MAFAAQLRGNWKQGPSDPNAQRSTGLAGLASLAVLGVEYTEPMSTHGPVQQMEKVDTVTGRKSKLVRSECSEMTMVS